MEYIIVIILVGLVALVVWSVARQGKIPDRVQRVEDFLSELRKEVGAAREITLDTAGRTIKGVTEVKGDLNAVREKADEIITDVREMNLALLMPTTRGAVGETLLATLLEDILPAKNIMTNYTFRDGSRVEFAVKLKEMVIPIDAKFPVEAYRRFAQATDAREKKEADTDFKRAVNKAAGEIKKDYVKPDEGANFAFMYLPAEGIFYHLISSHEELVTEMRRGNVFPVGPTTVVAYLETIARGLQGMQIEKRAREILGGIDELDRRLTNLRLPFDTAATHLKNAQNKFDEALRAIDAVDDTLRRLRAPLGEDTDSSGL